MKPIALVSVFFFAGVLELILAKGLNHAPLSDEEIEYINSAQTSWKAGRNFDKKNFAYVKNLLGVDREDNRRYNKLHQHTLRERPPGTVSDLPTNFDPREKWPNCESIKEIRDQGECGSCYVFGPVEAMSDRLCIATGKNIRLSTEDVLTCCDDCGKGCDGGRPLGVWGYYQDETGPGIVTGGSYGSNKGCMPYTLEPCDHHVSGKLRNCSSTFKPTPECTSQCIHSYNSTYKEDKHFGKSVYWLRGVENITQDLFTSGPVSADFIVYSDFLSYKSGVYKHVTGEKQGGHAVKILGWGVDNGEDYWLVANSWNVDWGDNGLFKIAKGSNECGIEENVMGGLPKV